MTVLPFRACIEAAGAAYKFFDTIPAVAADCIEKLSYCGGRRDEFARVVRRGLTQLMGPRRVEQGALFYEVSLETHVPADHLLRGIDRFVDLGSLRRGLAPFYASTGHPSIGPELMVRMLFVGYCLGIRPPTSMVDRRGVHAFRTARDGETARPS